MPTRKALLVAAGLGTVLSLTAGGLALAATGSPAGTTTATYHPDTSWGTGYQAEYLVANGGSAEIHTWKLEFDLPAGVRLSSVWGGDASATGGHVTVSPQAWDADLAPGATADVGFVATGSGPPTGCLIDGQACGPATPPTTPVGTATTAPPTTPVTTPTTTPPTTTAPTTAPPVTTTTPPTTPPVTTTTAPGGSAPAAAPYVDTSLYPPFDLVNTAKATGLRVFNLAFVVSGGGCTPKWGGVSALGDDQVASQIGALRAIGGDVRVSFGGASGTELAGACTSTDTLTAAYQQVVSAYGLTRIDFDVEGAAIEDTAANARRASAVAALQRTAAAAGHPLQVSLTLPVLPSGLTQDGLNVVSGMKAAGVDVNAVNVMAMDYGDGAAPNPSGQMGTYAIQAATATEGQVKQILGGTDAQAWAKVAVTPMIGVNDTSDEVFTPADAQQLVAFARSVHLGWLSMWSGARDKACPGGPQAYASATCSSIAQSDLAFSTTLAGYTG